MTSLRRYDIAVVGGGMAGMAVGANLAAKGRKVIILDQYDTIPNGATGRSAALYSTAYFSSPEFCRLTVASRRFFDDPPAGFSDVPLVRKCGALYVAGAHDEPDLVRFWSCVKESPAHAILLQHPTEIRELAPVLRQGYPLMAVHEPDAMRMNVAAIHGGYRRTLESLGGTVVPGAKVHDAQWHYGSGWLLSVTGRNFVEAETVVDASGAWGDETGKTFGGTHLGLNNLKRTAFISQLERRPSHFGASPFVFAASERLYFCPEGAGVLISPSDQTPTTPRDETPDGADIAAAAERFHEMTVARLKARPERSWAGIRTFAPDRKPVIGFDPDAPNLFRLLGHGGYGIQSAPATAVLAAAALCGEEMPDELAMLGLTFESVSPSRFRALREAAD